jgi:hypothetical protein
MGSPPPGPLGPAALNSAAQAPLPGTLPRRACARAACWSSSGAAGCRAGVRSVQLQHAPGPRPAPRPAPSP